MDSVGATKKLGGYFTVILGLISNLPVSPSARGKKFQLNFLMISEAKSNTLFSNSSGM
jgi:hypothetical protein